MKHRHRKNNTTDAKRQNKRPDTRKHSDDAEGPEQTLAPAALAVRTLSRTAPGQNQDPADVTVVKKLVVADMMSSLSSSLAPADTDGVTELIRTVSTSHRQRSTRFVPGALVTAVTQLLFVPVQFVSALKLS